MCDYFILYASTNWEKREKEREGESERERGEEKKITGCIYYFLILVKGVKNKRVYYLHYPITILLCVRVKLSTFRVPRFFSKSIL